MMFNNTKKSTFKVKAIATGILILTILAIILYLDHTEKYIRIYGWILQVLGMCLAIKGVFDVRRVFKEPDLFEAFMAVLLSTILVRKDGNATGTLSNISVTPVKATIKQWYPDDPKLSTEKRLEGALKNIARLKEGYDLHNKNLEDLAKKLEGHKTKVDEDFSTIKEYFESFLKTLHLDGIMWALVGLVWLTVGLTLSTLAPEFASVLEPDTHPQNTPQSQAIQTKVTLEPLQLHSF